MTPGEHAQELMDTMPLEIKKRLDKLATMLAEKLGESRGHVVAGYNDAEFTVDEMCQDIALKLVELGWRKEEDNTGSTGQEEAR